MNNKAVKVNNLKQLKPYDETMLYSCSISFLNETYGIVKNLEKYGRDCFGTPLIRKITGIIHTYKIGYGSEEIKEKIELLEKITRTLDSVATDLKVLRALKIISDKQYGALIVKYGPIMTQTVNFINSLKNKHN